MSTAAIAADAFAAPQAEWNDQAVTAPAAPRLAQAQAQGPASSYWYYCTNPGGYYPYVQNCNQAWLRVIPNNVPPSVAAGG
jgi:hypothetical protein